jgi:hypothetical protein
MNCSALSEDRKVKLSKQYKKLDPVRLLKEIQKNSEKSRGILEKCLVTCWWC